MSNTEQTEQPETMGIETAQRVEQERITRRAALRKLGFGAGLAAFSLLGVDDIARMVGQRMERMARHNKVASQVAKEFQGAGIALANVTLSPSNIGLHCRGNTNTYGKANNCADCCTLGCNGDYASGSAAEGCITRAENYC